MGFNIWQPFSKHKLHLDLSYLAPIIDMQSVLFVVVAIGVFWLQEV